MTYHIYRTRGLILGSVSVGESNRFYKIFTEELGLIGATAQSVREERSKLRFSLQNYAWVKLDLVRGKSGWKIISGAEDRAYAFIKKEGSAQKIFARACLLIVRLVHGEEQDQKLFEDLLSVAEFLEKNSLPQSLETYFETLLTLRVLVRLGYIDPAPYTADFLGSNFSVDILESFSLLHEMAVRDIRSALEASHL